MTHDHYKEEHSARAELCGEAALITAYFPINKELDSAYCTHASEFLVKAMDIVKTAHCETLDLMITADLNLQPSQNYARDRAEWQVTLYAISNAAGHVMEICDHGDLGLPEVEENLERLRLAKLHLVRYEMRQIFKATTTLCERLGISTKELMAMPATREMVDRSVEAAVRVGVKESALRRMVHEFSGGEYEL